MGSSFLSAGPGAQGTGLSASDTLSVSFESSSREPVPSWSTTSTPGSGLTCSLLTPPPIVPDPGVPLHTPDLDGVLHPKPLPVTWALGPLWSLAVGVGVQCPPPLAHTSYRRGTAPRGGGSEWFSQTRRHHPASPQHPGEQTGVTELLGHMGRKQSQGLPPGLLSVCQSIFLSVCPQGPVFAPQAVCAVATLNICPAPRVGGKTPRGHSLCVEGNDDRDSGAAGQSAPRRGCKDTWPQSEIDTRPWVSAGTCHSSCICPSLSPGL